MHRKGLGSGRWAIAVAAVVVSIAALIYQRNYFTQSFLNAQADETLQLAKSIEHQVLDPLKEAAWGVADMAAIIETAAGKRPVDDPEALIILETTRKNFGASLVYVMNADGVVVACTTYGQGNTLTGNSYRFRPYFRDALKGRSVLYPALGITTYERGIYVSAPIYNIGPDPQGVLVIKSPTDRIDDFLLKFRDIAVLASPEGVIFASNREDWLYHLTEPLRQVEVEKLRESKQFADKPLKVLPSGIRLAGRSMTMEDARYGIARAEVGMSAASERPWQLTTLRRLKGAYHIPTLIILSLSTGSAAFFMGLFIAEMHIRSRLKREASEGRKYLAAILNSIGEAVVAFDDQDKIRHLNPAAERLTGLSAKEAVGRDKNEIMRLISPANGVASAQITRDMEKTDDLSQNVACRIRSEKGDERDVLKAVAPIIDEQGKVTGGAVMVLADVTSLRKAEEELRRERETLSVLLDGNPIPTFFIDREHRVVIWNKACEAITRVPKEKVMGRAVDSTIFYPPPPRPILADLVLGMDEKSIMTLYAGKDIKANSFIPEAYEATDHLTISGIGRDIFFLAARCRDSGGKIIGAIETLQDITESKKNQEERLNLERRLFQAQKSESLGRMAGAIAHHFNNMLAAVIGNLELASLAARNDPQLLDNIKEALKAARRAADMSQLMLAYLGQGIARQECIDLVDICKELIAGIKKTLPEGIRLEAGLPSSSLYVLSDPEQMRTMISSLTSNALEALEKRGGIVRISAGRCLPSKDKNIHRFPFDWKPREVEYGYLEVWDDGIGMDHDTIGKIFDPFFSTKFTGRGLGLPVVSGIAKSLGGGIEVESAPGRGSRFRVLLPLALPGTMKAHAEAAITNSSFKKGKVLVIEDEPMVRKMTERLLEKLGFGVVLAEDGEKGVETYSAKREEIVSVICDLTMPGIDGWETIKRLRAINPDLPILLSSGYDEMRAMEGKRTDLPQAFLHKPFSMSELTKAVSRALSSINLS